MKKANRFLYPFIFLLAVNIYSCSDSQNISDTRMLSFDDKWRFIKADPEGAENVTFDDSDWRNLDLPHDWSIENLPNQSDSAKGPFTKASPYKMRTGYTIGGTAWYRKTFTLDELEREKIAYLQFDGVYMFG
jgi:beta-galactosidase